MGQRRIQVGPAGPAWNWPDGSLLQASPALGDTERRRIPPAPFLTHLQQSHSQFEEKQVGCLNLRHVELESHLGLMETVIN